MPLSQHEFFQECCYEGVNICFQSFVWVISINYNILIYEQEYIFKYIYNHIWTLSILNLDDIAS